MKAEKKILMSVEAIRCLVNDCKSGLQNEISGGNKLAGEKLIRAAQKYDRARGDGVPSVAVEAMVRFYREGRTAIILAAR